jgi:hypothetical protein
MQWAAMAITVGWHGQHFFELQGDLPVEVVFALSKVQAKALLAKLREAKLELFWVSFPAEFGFLPCPVRADNHIESAGVKSGQTKLSLQWRS